MSSPDLEKELGELKTELFKLKFSLATNGLDNPMKIKEVKKDIAKINTVLTERKIAEAKAQIWQTKILKKFLNDDERAERETCKIRFENLVL